MGQDKSSALQEIDTAIQRGGLKCKTSDRNSGGGGAGAKAGPPPIPKTTGDAVWSGCILQQRAQSKSCLSAGYAASTFLPGAGVSGAKGHPGLVTGCQNESVQLHRNPVTLPAPPEIPQCPALITNKSKRGIIKYCSLLCYGCGTKRPKDRRDIGKYSRKTLPLKGKTSHPFSPPPPPDWSCSSNKVRAASSIHCPAHPLGWHRDQGSTLWF